MLAAHTLPTVGTSGIRKPFALIARYMPTKQSGSRAGAGEGGGGGRGGAEIPAAKAC